MTAEEYLKDWLKIFDKGAFEDVLHIIGHLYKKRGDICPRQQDVFKAFSLTPLKELRAVFLFQDPYPQKGVATGIAIGNHKDTPEEKLSPSLKVVKEAVINMEISHNIITFDNSLESWSKQGILMLNTALTVEENNIGSHVGIWKPFIMNLLKNLSIHETGIVYALFGRQAQTFEPYINKKYNHVLKENHPAYYVRNHMKMPNTIFRKTDEILSSIYGIGVEWFLEEK